MSWIWAALVAVAMLCLATVCAVAAVGNLREFRAAARRPPLEMAEVLGSERRASSAPPSWPQPASITDHRVAAAYRDYARERRDTLVLAGEVSLLTGGAALGAVLPRAFSDTWAMVGGAAAVALGAFGHLMKHHGGGKWTRVAGLYERRRGALRRASEPALPPAPLTETGPSGLLRALGVLLGRCRSRSL